MQKNILVIFGAPDPEATAARIVAAKADCMIATATVDGAPVHAGNAYRANGIQNDGDNAGVLNASTTIVLFECQLTPALPNETIVCDHHMPGHPGFGRPAAKAVEASSLGQLAAILGVGLTQEQRTIAAMDHNLFGAYAGQTPGVNPDEVLALRAAELAKRSGLFLEAAKAELARVIDLLKTTKPLENGVVDLRSLGVNAFIGDASAMTGIPSLGFQDGRSPNKLNLCNPTPAQAEAFMSSWGDQLGLEAEGRYNARNLICGGNVAAIKN